MADRRYTKSHEWVTVDGKTATVGITDFAQSQLGDVVFLELPSPGRKVAEREAFGVVESVKAASDLYSPVAGRISAV
ncbi:MAG: glycine cleavage system protein H, partial [Candidatus Dormibacteraceae bacterium]